MKTQVTAAQVARFCDLLTNGKNIADFQGSRNGLQHKGTRPVRKVGAAVDAGAKVFAEAARRGVDFLIVHHGMYWRPVSPEREVRALRKAALKKAGLSLYSSHLPLDAHPAIGNNALGVAGVTDAHFDIADVTNTALAALSTRDAPAPTLYRIDLATGQANAIGTIGNGEPLRGIAVEP